MHYDGFLGGDEGDTDADNPGQAGHVLLDGAHTAGAGHAPDLARN